MLDDGPREMADLALAWMNNTARAATLLPDGNLRIWPLPGLTAHDDPHVSRLASAMAMLRSVERIRPPCACRICSASG